MVSRLTRLSLLEPTVREVGVRPLRWSLLLLPVLVVGLVFGVREISRVERVLAAEGTRASRVIVYELLPGATLRVPIEPGTDVFRVVAHAERAGSLSAEPHVARLVIAGKGELGSRSEDVVLELPGTTERVNPEDSSYVVGDPAGVNFDAHELGTGELSITLAAIEGADGVLVRIYRREALGVEEIGRRTAHIDSKSRDHLAHRAGEIEWADLDAPEQTAILGARWRKVAALRDEKDVVSRAIALAPPPPQKRDERVREEAAMSVTDIRGDERIAVVAHGKTTVRVRAEADPEAMVLATIRALDGSVRELSGKGELAIDVPASQVLGIEVTRSTPGFLSLRSDEATKIEPTTHAVMWRATPTRPVIVTAGSEALVLRVAARRTVSRSSTGEAQIALDATITPPSGTPETTMLRASRARSIYDRFDVREPLDAPTSSAIFHILVPAHGTVTLTPEDTSLDLALAELDPSAPPRPVRSYPADGAPAPVTEVGDLEWPGYVPRRPTNVAAFEPSGRTLLRIPHRFVPVPTPESKAPTFRVKRPESTESIVVNKRVFDPATVSFEIDVPGGEPLVLPVHLYSKEPIAVTALIDGVVPTRRTIGTAERVTTGRVTTVDGEVRTVVVLGDDLPPGPHVLTFVTAPGKEAWVHLPWTPKPRPPGAPAHDPHWIEGDLEE